MHIPPFSVFSALSELVVTAGVLWIIRRNWTGRRFPLAAFLAVVLFEALVNVLYMANRAARAATGVEEISRAMRLSYAAHGGLSLIAFVAFVILGVIAYQEQGGGRWFFRERPGLTWTFTVVWMISVLSGEAIFALRYLA